MTEGQWHNVIRIVHLVGGLKAINNPGSEVIIPLGSNDPIPKKFSIDRYHDLPLNLISLGFKIVGIDYYETITDNSLASDLCEITEKEVGWLAKLSDYRDLVVHYVPLGQATRREFVVRRFLPDNSLGNLPSIYFPIPSNPFSVKQVRSKGSPFESVSEWIEASKQDDKSAPDALEYCLHLACKIAQEAPIAPEIPTFVKGVDIQEVVQ